MMKFRLITFSLILSSTTLFAQSLEKPVVPNPSLKRVKTTHYSSAGYMGLFDMNMAGGYITKVAHETFPGYSPRDLSSTGQYVNFRFQEGILSNYFLAKKYKKNKRVKFGFQETFDLGMKWGTAASTSTNHTTDTLNQAVSTLSPYFGYQAAGAIVVRVNSSIDVGFTYYPYVRTALCPGNNSYAKLRLRYDHFTAEYSFNGKTALDLKYVKSRKLYVGLSYSKFNQNFSNSYSGISNVTTNFYQLSIGRVF